MKETLIGPFSQIVTMDGLKPSGHLNDSDLQIIENGGVIVENELIKKVGPYSSLDSPAITKKAVKSPAVLLPGFIDSHTHICFGGSRCKDYALRLEGKTYQEIAAAGGGIKDSVQKTRAATLEELCASLLERTKTLLARGVTTCEVKSGYGLNVTDEVKMLKAIHLVSEKQPVDLIATCLAAHTRPKEFDSNKEYLDYIIQDLLVLVKSQNLSKRIDIFVEKGAFSVEEARPYLKKAKEMGFSICIHADQFSRGASILAAEEGALSADHLEESGEEDFIALKKGNVIPIVLPGSSLGLGIRFAHAKKILDNDLPLVIASDWNPGSAPNGDLLLQAAILGIYEKLSMAETFAAITVRAAKALELTDRGVIKNGMRADMVAFPCSDYREILYRQGSMKPSLVYKGGNQHIG